MKISGIDAALFDQRAPWAVLFDRDGTLVEDVPYNGDPELVRPVPGARAVLDRLRRRGIPIGVVSNQSGIARGLLSDLQVRRVNRRVEELVGPIAVWAVCPHGPEDGCGCRKPRPGLVLRAAARLGVPPSRCAVVGDIGADVEAARSAGARAVLVPTPVTRPEEVAAAPEVAADLDAAVTRLLSARGGGPPLPEPPLLSGTFGAPPAPPFGSGGGVWRTREDGLTQRAEPDLTARPGIWTARSGTWLASRGGQG